MASKLDLGAYGTSPPGTWTPVPSFGTPGSSSFSGVSAAGLCTKVGNLVLFQFSLIVGTVTLTGASGNLNISGLPYPINLGAGALAPAVRGGATELVSGITLPAGAFLPVPVGVGPTTDSFFLQWVSLTSGGTVQSSNLTGGGGFIIRATGEYYTS